LDGLIERAFVGEWPPLARATLNICQRSHFILKLHGTLLDRSTWVLTREDYDRDNLVLRNVLRSLYSTYTLLFLGHEDLSEDIRHLLSEMRAYSSEQPPRHFALVAEAHAAGPFGQWLLESAGVRQIVYRDPDGKHAEAARLLLQ